MARFRGVLTIDRNLCKGCALCVQACPAEVLRLDEEINDKGYNPAQVSRPEQCTGCALCALMCPDVCIRVQVAPAGEEGA